MNELITQLYELMYSPIITPYNLLENAKLDNYAYVNYSKENNGLLVVMECEIEKGFIAKFYYHFDNNDRLSLATMECNNRQEIIFCRETEILKTKNIISEKLKQPFSEHAI